MREDLKVLCEKFAVNRETVKKAFPCESEYLYPLCAIRLTGSGKENVTAEELKEMKQLIRRENGVFSAYRNAMHVVCATELALSADPAERMRKAQAVLTALKGSFSGSSYLALLSLQLSGQLLEDADGSPGDLEEKIRRGKEIYRLMRREHPVLTGSEDSVMAVLLAFSEKGNEELVADMEQAYRTLKDRISWSSGDALQTLSHILALTGRTDAADRVVELLDTLRGRGCAYGKEYQLTALGMLALSDRDVNSLAEDIMDADAVLKEQKGYGFFGMDAKMRRMHAAMLTELAVEAEKPLAKSAVSVGMPTAMVGGIGALVSSEAAMLAALAAASAVSFSAATSHHG